VAGKKNAAQRKKLSHAGPKDANREAKLACRAMAQRRRKAPSRVGCSDLLGTLGFVIVAFLVLRLN